MIKTRSFDLKKIKKCFVFASSFRFSAEKMLDENGKIQVKFDVADFQGFTPILRLLQEE